MIASRLLLGTIAGSLLVLLLAASASAAYRFAGSFGREGKGAGEFGSGVLGGGSERQWDDPAGIGVARDGTVWLVDVSNNRVEHFTAAGRFLGQFGIRGHDQGFIRLRMTDRLFQPEGMTVDPAGNLIVADSGNDRVMKYNSRGRFLKRLNRTGSFPGEVVQPWGVSVGGGQVFVTDQGNYQIDRVGLNGGFRGSFGTFGRRPGQFVTPYGVAATATASVVYVTDLIRHKVLAFTGGGRFIKEWGSAGDGPGQFLKPAGIVVGLDGTVFVTDRCNWRVQRFTADGQFIESFGEGRLASPTFLAQDRAGNIYVSDYHRVVGFSPVAGLRPRSRPPARSASHNDIDIVCRHVAEMNDVDERRPPRG